MNDGMHARLANAALPHYRLQAPSAAFIRHNENLAFCVTDGDAKYLLRIHEPASANFVGPYQRLECIESELRWLEVLQGEMIVQKPMKNVDWEWVTTFTLDEIDRRCTLLSWIEGEEFDQKAPEASDRMREVGAMIARLHHHTRAWLPPRGFVRPTYDDGHLQDIHRKLQPAIDFEWLTSAEFGIMESALEEIRIVFVSERSTPGAWGLVHADLGPWNLIVHDRGVSPIDFSLCALGPYLWDLGAGMVSYDRELRRPFVEGYGPLPEGALRTMEACAILGILSCFSMHISNPNSHRWLAPRIPRSVDREWRPFLSGVPFLFDI